MQNPQEAWLASTRAQSLGSGIVEVNGTTYEYDVLPASFIPEVPYFVLFPFGERLFISEQVAERYRAAFCASEVWNCLLQSSGAINHFEQAVEHELSYVPANDAVDYLMMRMLCFESLLSPVASLLPAYSEQIIACRDIFKHKLEGMMSLTKH
jgi:hypothetical protein